MNRLAFTSLLTIVLVATGSSFGQGTAEDDPRLYSTLWMRTSAEYQALCRQVYAVATQSLLRRAASLRGAARPPAVVMDLDETVLDNSAYQIYKLKGGEQSFTEFVRDNVAEIRLVAGVKEFIDVMEHNGVVVVFVSNRSDQSARETVDTLERNDIRTARAEGTTIDERVQQMKLERRLLLRTSRDRSKRPRRLLVAERYAIVGYVGDTLSDFPGPFEKRGDPSPEVRRAIVADVLSESPSAFGTRWFLLPNPVYGDWESALGEDPTEFVE